MYSSSSMVLTNVNWSEGDWKLSMDHKEEVGLVLQGLVHYVVKNVFGVVYSKARADQKRLVHSQALWLEIVLAIGVNFW